MEIVIGWLILSVVVSYLASSRGRSNLGWGLCALIFSPLLTGIVLFCVPDLKVAVAAQGVAKQQAEQKQQEALLTTGAAVAEELQKIANLKKMGVVSAEESEAQKEMLFQRLSGRRTKESLGDFFTPLGKLLENGDLDTKNLARLKGIYVAISK